MATSARWRKDSEKRRTEGVYIMTTSLQKMTTSIDDWSRSHALSSIVLWAVCTYIYTLQILQKEYLRYVNPFVPWAICTYLEILQKECMHLFRCFDWSKKDWSTNIITYLSSSARKTIVNQKANNWWIHSARSVLYWLVLSITDDVLFSDDETTQGKGEKRNRSASFRCLLEIIKKAVLL